MTMRKTAQIRMWGGFHNSPLITIKVKNNEVFNDFQMGFCGLSDLITPYQRKRLEKHFCGISGCTCGSYNRAWMEVEPSK